MTRLIILVIMLALLLGFVPVNAAMPAYMDIVTDKETYEIGDIVTLMVNAKNVNDLNRISFRLSYAGDLLLLCQDNIQKVDYDNWHASVQIEENHIQFQGQYEDGIIGRTGDMPLLVLQFEVKELPVPMFPPSYYPTIEVKDISGNDILGNSIQMEFESWYINRPHYEVTAEFNPPSIKSNALFFANVSVHNYTREEGPVMAIVALYGADGRMINVSYNSKVIESKGWVELTAGFKLPSDVEGCMVKVFVWDGTRLEDSKMIPLSQIITLE